MEVTTPLPMMKPMSDKTNNKNTLNGRAKDVTLANFVETNDNQSIVSIKGEAIKEVSLKNLLVGYYLSCI